MKLSKKNNFSFKKRLKRFFIRYRGKYYAQNGEDIVVWQYLKNIKNIRDVTYLDIGCGDCKFLSNTYLLYTMGASGYVCDANQNYEKKYKRLRPRDKFLNYLITNSLNQNKKFFITDMRELSTCDETKIKYLTENGFKIKSEKNVPTKTLNEVWGEVTKEKEIDFLSLDIESDEINLLENLDMTNHKPIVICVEVVDFETGENSSKTESFIEYMKKKNFKVLLNTKVNIIFVREGG